MKASEFTEGNIKAVLARLVSQLTEQAMEDEFEARLDLRRAEAAKAEYDRNEEYGGGFGGGGRYQTEVERTQVEHRNQVDTLERWKVIRDWTFEKLIGACPIRIRTR